MTTPTKMTPGDELHLTLLMAPQGLNFVTGQDRQHLLAYARAAFDAGKASAPQTAQPTHVSSAHDSLPAPGDAPSKNDTATLEQIADLFQIGASARLDRGVIVANVRNAARRAACLGRIEDRFFTVPCPAVDGDDEDSGGEECLLIWGHTPDAYEKQFAEALVQTQAAGVPAAAPDARDDAALLDFLLAESLDLRCFASRTGGDDADIGWRTVQHHMGKPSERVASEVYDDDPRRAIREAMARLKRDPYCIGPLHEEDSDAWKCEACKGTGLRKFESYGDSPRGQYPIIQTEDCSECNATGWCGPDAAIAAQAGKGVQHG